MREISGFDRGGDHTRGEGTIFSIGHLLILFERWGGGIF